MTEITQAIAAKVLEVVDCGLVSGLGKPAPGMMCVEAAVCYALGLPHGDDPACVSHALRSLKIRLNDSNWSSNQARAKGLRRLAVAQLGSAGALDDIKFVQRVARMTIAVFVPRALRAAAAVRRNEKHKAALLEASAKCEADPTEANAREAHKIAFTAYGAAYADAAAYAAAYAADAAANAAAAAAAYAANAAAAAADAAYAAAYAADAAAYANAAANAAAAYANAAANAAAAADAANAAANAANAAACDLVLSEFAEAVVQILIEMDAPGCQWLALTEAA